MKHVDQEMRLRMKARTSIRSTVDWTALAIARQQSGAASQQPFAGGSPCGFRSQGGRADGGEMKAGGVPLSQLVAVLSQIFQDTVVDTTGLTGDFDWDLKWAADPAPSIRPQDAPFAAASGASMVTALQEQLGLRLRRRNAPVHVLVIDHDEQPTPD
jgi:uncharacterized protein (TIGR03435 family)